jgi:hypothetical protein
MHSVEVPASSDDGPLLPGLVEAVPALTLQARDGGTGASERGRHEAERAPHAHNGNRKAPEGCARGRSRRIESERVRVHGYVHLQGYEDLGRSRSERRESTTGKFHPGCGLAPTASVPCDAKSSINPVLPSLANVLSPRPGA